MIEPKDIKGYEGVYTIDVNGNIYSKPRLIKRPLNNNYTTKGKYLKPQSDKNGYMTVNLYKNKIPKKFKVHRLVADSFIPNKENKETVDHINFNKKDNCVENLQWLSREDNYRRAVDLEFNHTEGIIVLNKINGVFHKSISEAARCYNIGRKTLEYRLRNNTSEKLILI